MNNKFDEPAKGLAQSVTRRGALKKFGLGLAGIALASLGLTNKAQAGKNNYNCHCGSKPDFGCGRQYPVGSADYYACVDYCNFACSN